MYVSIGELVLVLCHGRNRSRVGKCEPLAWKTGQRRFPPSRVIEAHEGWVERRVSERSRPSAQLNVYSDVIALGFGRRTKDDEQ